ncbi:MAG: hypothetical protein M1823_000803 [Watsoniomyces obsoletus]|nr:MAG: hypothetical protein M1823_000803 [Watsoniomyces obsoletus]
MNSIWRTQLFASSRVRNTWRQQQRRGVRAPPPRAPPPSPRRRPPPSRNEKSGGAAASSAGAVSQVLQDTSAQKNSLLSSVHVGHTQNGVLNEEHPAAKLLSNSAIVVQRQLELMNVMIGFEQANKYVIMDPHGNHIGYMAEQELGMGNMMARQWFRTHRSFTTHVFDKHEVEVLRFHRPFSWVSSRIRVLDPLTSQGAVTSTSVDLQPQPSGGALQTTQSSPNVSQLPLSDMRIIGEAHQQWAPLRRKYNLFVYDSPNSGRDLPQEEADSGDFSQFAYVDEPFLSWDFSLLSADSRLIGSVNRNFAGFAREILTDTGVYALRMDAAGLAEEPRHMISQTGSKTPSAYDTSSAGMTLDQRAVMLATAVSIDFDYFSKRSGAGGMGFMPIWFPGAGGTAAEGGAVVEAEAGAGQAVGGVAGRAAGGVGPGEAAAAGGTMAGYEAMRQGQQSTPEQTSVTEQSPGSEGTQPGQQEDVWGESTSDPWGQGGNDGWPPTSGSEGGGGGGGGGGGDGGDGFDVSDWF